MSEIKTWHQRCMEHPDHQNGMVSDEMIRARMCEEIGDLRARVTVLETALRHYADDDYNGYNGSGDCARAALEAKP